MKVYKGIGPNEGKIVREQEAFAYACERCGVTFIYPNAPEFKEFYEMLVEWYFSGNWIEEDVDG